MELVRKNNILVDFKLLLFYKAKISNDNQLKFIYSYFRDTFIQRRKKESLYNLSHYFKIKFY